MAIIVIAYATREGHTAKVAQYLATAMRQAGNEVQLLDTDRPPGDLHLDAADAIVVAAPIRAGGYPSSIGRFVRTHAHDLTRVPTAFCSVGLAVASRTTDGRAKTQTVVDNFLRRSGWRPDRTELVAGALAYSKYNFVVRFVMRRIAAANGGDVDTSRDYEYTDWEGLRRFAGAIVCDANPSRSHH